MLSIQTKLLLGLLPAVLTGCQTLFAHYEMPEDTMSSIAAGTVETEACAKYGLLSKSLAEEFRITTTHMLDIAVLDYAYYDKRFTEAHTSFYSRSPDEVRQRCKVIAQRLPSINANYRRDYRRIVQSLNQARAAESKAISNFANQQNYTADPIQSEPFQNEPIEWGHVPGSYSTKNNGTMRYMRNTPNGIEYQTCQNLDGNYQYCY